MKDQNRVVTNDLKETFEQRITAELADGNEPPATEEVKEEAKEPAPEPEKTEETAEPFSGVLEEMFGPEATEDEKKPDDRDRMIEQMQQQINTLEQMVASNKQPASVSAAPTAEAAQTPQASLDPAVQAALSSIGYDTEATSVLANYLTKLEHRAQSAEETVRQVVGSQQAQQEAGQRKYYTSLINEAVKKNKGSRFHDIVGKLDDNEDQIVVRNDEDLRAAIDHYALKSQREMRKFAYDLLKGSYDNSRKNKVADTVETVTKPKARAKDEPKKDIDMLSPEGRAALKEELQRKVDEKLKGSK